MLSCPNCGTVKATEEPFICPKCGRQYKPIEINRAKRHMEYFDSDTDPAFSKINPKNTVKEA